ncbi:MAG: ComF family protein [Desulfobulbaceae bacterium]|nr:ComF family protein [Desulfobulbaceae bacterium]
MLNQLRNFFRSTLDLLLPPSCLACGKPLSSAQKILFCASCAEQIPFITPPLCTCCGRPYPKAAGDNHFCGLCLTDKRYFDRARAIFIYEAPFKKIIHSFKYQGQTAGLAGFRLLKQQLPHLDEVDAVDLIVPVPLHKKRLQARGFNQALLLARAFFPKDGRITTELLLRPGWTEPQTSFNGQARRKNLKNAFFVQKPQQVTNKKILLIDDVFTTGTTVNECARALKKAGAAEVMVLTLARVREE